MADPRPLTPPEVRELLRSTDGPKFHIDADDPEYDLAFAVWQIPQLRLTLERYAELAEAFGGD